ncbi:MAG: hypothetical protein WBB67_04295 [bacterium]
MLNDLQLVAKWLTRTRKASKEAHQILATLEHSKSRIITIEKLFDKLSGLPVDVQDYFHEAINCLQYDFLRAAVVLSWAGFCHVLTEKMYSLHASDIKKKRTRWKFSTLTDLKENYPESQILDAAKEVGFIKRNVLRVYQGQLQTRNNCAHPTLFKPSINSALGFVDDMVRQTIAFL